MIKLSQIIVLVFCITESYASNDLDSLYNLLSNEKDTSSFISIAQTHDSIALELKEYKKLANMYFLLGYKYRSINKNIDAIKSYKSSRKYYKKAGDFVGQEQIIENIGRIYWNQYNFKSALKYYKEALRINKKLGNEFQMAQSNFDIGLILSEQKKVLKSIEYYKKALTSFLKQNKRLNASYVLINLGLAFKDLESYKIASDYYHQAINVSPDSKKIKAMAYNNVSKLLFRQNNVEEAIKKAEYSLELKRGLNDSSFLITTLNHLGIYYFKEKKYKEATAVLQEAFHKNNILEVSGDKGRELFISYTYLDSIKTKTDNKYLLVDLNIYPKYDAFNLRMMNDHLILRKEDQKLLAELDEEKQERNNERNMAIIIILFLMLSFLGWKIYSMYKSKVIKAILSRSLSRMEKNINPNAS